MVDIDTNSLIIFDDFFKNNQNNTMSSIEEKDSIVYDELTNIVVVESNSSKNTSPQIDSNSSLFQVDVVKKYNEDYLQNLNLRVTPLLISIIRIDDFDFGTKGPSARLVEEHLKTNEFVTEKWLTALFTRAFGESDENILIGLLKIIEALIPNNESAQSIGKIYAICALAHKNIEIQEIGLRILESRCNEENLKILSNLSAFSTSWLNEYLQQIIKDFREELCLL
jgi:hypothetical protein